VPCTLKYPGGGGGDWGGGDWGGGLLATFGWSLPVYPLYETLGGLAMLLCWL
jgi:hypothetical protein